MTGFPMSPRSLRSGSVLIDAESDIGAANDRGGKDMHEYEAAS